MKNTLTSVIILFICSLSSFGQLTQFTIDGIGGNGADFQIVDTEIDQFGNLFVTGIVYNGINESADLDPSDAEFTVSSGSIFLAKYSMDGKLLFGREFVRPGETGSLCANGCGPNISLDNDGNIYLSGDSDFTDFDGGTGVAYHPSLSTSPTAYLAKYNSNGNLIFLHSWLPEVNNSLSNISSQQLELTENTLIVSGSYSGEINFNPTGGTDINNGAGIFISRFDTDGIYLGSSLLKQSGGGFSSYSSYQVHSMSVTGSGSTVLFGKYSGTVDFDPSTTVYELESPSCGGQQSGFGCKLSTSGELLSAGRFDQPVGTCVSPDYTRVEIKNDKVYCWFSGAGGYQFDLDFGSGVYNDGGRGILVMDTSLNFIEYQRFDNNTDFAGARADFCLTKDGFVFAGINNAGSSMEIVYALGSSDILPDHRHFILAYDFDYNLIDAIITNGGDYGAYPKVCYDSYNDEIITSLIMDETYSLQDELGQELESIQRAEVFTAFLRTGFRKNVLTGKVYIDLDGNGVITELDTVERGIVVSSIDDIGNTRYSATRTDGRYKFYLDTAQYVTQANPVLDNPYWYFTPNTINTVFSSYTDYDTLNDFIMTYDVPATDIVVSVVNTRSVRLNQDVGHVITCVNVGTQTETISVEWIADANYTIVSSSHPYVVSGNTIIWNQINIEPFENEQITATITNSAPSGVLTNTITAITATTDQDYSDNIVTLESTVIASYDPNDKQVFPREALTAQEGANGRWLDYLIRFQNTGNDTAFNIYILDTLSYWLDTSTLQILTSSDDYQASFKDSNVIELRFDNILLPDSTTDESNSHGYIAYRIKMLGGLSISDTIENRAAIYFDYNEPIITNTAKNYIQVITSSVDIENRVLNIYPNPSNGKYYVNAKGNVRVFDVSGKEVYRTSSFNAPTEVDLSALPSGIYTIQLTNKGGVFTGKLVRE
jgi:hypothetical protein